MQFCKKLTQRLHYRLDKEVSHLEIKIVAFLHEKRRHSHIAVLMTMNKIRVQAKLQSSCPIRVLQIILQLFNPHVMEVFLSKDVHNATVLRL